MARAIRLHRPKEPVELDELPSAPLGAGAARVRIEACALGQLDWNLLTLDAPPRLPLVAGHEACGVVVEVALGSPRAVGERVLLTVLASTCGACRRCRSGQRRWCPAAKWRGLHAPGLLSSEVVVEAHELAVPLRSPPQPLEAVCGGSLWTAVGAVRALGLEAPARVGVFGIGGVGHLVVQVSRALGFETVAFDLDPERRALGQSLGGDAAPGPLDGAIICTPSTQAVQQAARELAPGGVVSLTGTSPTGRLDLPTNELVLRGLTVRGSVLGSDAELLEGIELLQSGRVTPRVERVAFEALPSRLWALRDGGFLGRLLAVP